MNDIVTNAGNFIGTQLFSIAGTIQPKVTFLSTNIVYYLILAVVAFIIASLIRTEKDFRYWLLVAGIWFLLFSFGKGGII